MRHHVNLDNPLHVTYRETKTYMNFCDLGCPYARWPEDKALDGSESCRTFQALYCAKKKSLVYKNAPGHERREHPVRASQKSSPRSKARK